MMRQKTALPAPLKPERETSHPVRFDALNLDSPDAFEHLAAVIRDKTLNRPMSDETRHLLEEGVTQLRMAVPDLGDRDIARVLMASAQLQVQAIDFGPHWVRPVLVTMLLNLAEQLWRQDKPGAAKLLEQLDAAASHETSYYGQPCCCRDGSTCASCSIGRHSDCPENPEREPRDQGDEEAEAGE